MIYSQISNLAVYFAFQRPWKVSYAKNSSLPYVKTYIKSSSG